MNPEPIVTQRECATYWHVDMELVKPRQLADYLAALLIRFGCKHDSIAVRRARLLGEQVDIGSAAAPDRVSGMSMRLKGGDTPGIATVTWYHYSEDGPYAETIASLLSGRVRHEITDSGAADDRLAEALHIAEFDA